MPMVSLDGADQLRLLLQFGWACAELRGRYRQELIGLPTLPLARQTRTEQTLPLNNERSSDELRLQSVHEVRDLATRLTFDFPIADVPYQSKNATGTIVERLAALDLVVRDADAADQKEKDTLWNNIASLFSGWDTKIQDTLSSASSLEAGAYQLGRGFAEAYWSLHPSVAEPDVRSWTALLGPARRGTLKRFLVQLTPLYDAGAVSALATSLDAWGEVVTTQPALCARPETVQQLQAQIRVWRTLLVDHVDPRCYEDPRTAAGYAGRIGALLKTFWSELALAVGAGAVALVSIVVLVAFKGSGAAAVLVAILGFFGVTGAGLLATAKAAANASLAKMRAALDAEILAAAVTVPPATVKKGSQSR